MSKRKAKAPPPVADPNPLPGFSVGDYVVTPDCDRAVILEHVGHDCLEGRRVVSLALHPRGSDLVTEGSPSWSELVSCCPGVAIQHYDRYVIRVEAHEVAGLDRDRLRALARSRIPSAHDALQDERAAAQRLIAERDEARSCCERAERAETATRSALDAAQERVRVLGLQVGRLAEQLDVHQRLVTELRAEREETARDTVAVLADRDARLAELRADRDALAHCSVELAEMRRERDAARADASLALELRDRAEASEARLRRITDEEIARLWTRGDELRAELTVATAESARLRTVQDALIADRDRQETALRSELAAAQRLAALRAETGGVDLAPLREAVEVVSACKCCFTFGPHAGAVERAVRALLEAHPEPEPPQSRGAAECCAHSTVALIDDLAPAPIPSEPAPAALADQDLVAVPGPCCGCAPDRVDAGRFCGCECHGAAVAAAATDETEASPCEFCHGLLAPGERHAVCERGETGQPSPRRSRAQLAAPAPIPSEPAPAVLAEHSIWDGCERRPDPEEVLAATAAQDADGEDQAIEAILDQLVDQGLMERAPALRAVRRSQPVAAITPRVRPCPVCGGGVGEVHVCCPRCVSRGVPTTTARSEAEVRALFGTRENGTAAQPWCWECRRLSAAASRAAKERPATEPAEAPRG